MKIDFNIKEFIMHKKKEIAVVVIYTLLFSLLIGLISNINIKIEDAEFDRDLAERQYNNIKNSNLSEEALGKELREITFEFEELNKKLPSNLDHIEVNKMLAEIAKANGNLFNLGNCNITQVERKDGYTSFEVKISYVKGSYNQFKNFVNYVESYKSKVVVSQVDLTRNSSEVQGSMTLVFFGEKGVGEAI